MNHTNGFIKWRRFNKMKQCYDARTLKTYHLKTLKQMIIKYYPYIYIDETTGNTKNVTINSHILDQAIKDTCTAYKSAISNLENRKKEQKNRSNKYDKVNKWIKKNYKKK